MSFRKPVSQRSIGIEIECFIQYDEMHLPQYHEYYGFFQAQRDGSIEPPMSYKPVEFVSQPLTAKWLRREVHRLNKKFNWRHNETCGIHIHASRKWVSKERAAAIGAFLMDHISDQDFCDLFGRPPNGYCRNYYDEAYTASRYRAVNNTNDTTIEFRMFRSGNAMWAGYCIDMVEYLIDNAFHLNCDALMAFHDMTYKDSMG